MGSKKTAKRTPKTATKRAPKASSRATTAKRTPKASSTAKRPAKASAAKRGTKAGTAKRSAKAGAAKRGAGAAKRGAKAGVSASAVARTPAPTSTGRSSLEKQQAARMQLEAALQSPSPTVQIGPRLFRLNFTTGIAYVIDGPRLPGSSGLGRQQLTAIHRALPARPAGTVEGLLGWRLTDEPWADGHRRNDPLERRDRRCQNDKDPEIVFTMGLPGSGKSTTLKRMGILETHGIIDPDLIKQELPGYDPKKPWLVHAESARRAEAMFRAALASGVGRHAVDGTGTTVETMIRRIRQAQLAGFYTRVIYVRVGLNTAIARNAARVRVVPEEVIREKALDMETSVSLLQDEANCFVQINND